MKKIVCFHLLNDYSGSPKVLEMVLNGLLDKGYEVDLITSNTEGVLSQLNGKNNFKMITYPYKFSSNHFITFVKFIFVQFISLFIAIKYLFNKNVIFYINTILPVCPALVARIIGKRVIYHYHENASAKGMLYKILEWCMQKLAHKIICVSKYQSLFLKRRDGISVIPNSISTDFIKKLKPNSNAAFERKTILMLGSLKIYKGTIEFFKLAENLPDYRFKLVINDTQCNIDEFIINNGLSITSNLEVFARQSDVSSFYNSSSIVLNLSNKKLFVETFGLTALEAISAALPVIVPTVGGIAELVEDGVNGYKIDVQDLSKISETIIKVLSDKNLYSSLSEKALIISRKYSENNMTTQIISLIS